MLLELVNGSDVTRVPNLGFYSALGLEGGPWGMNLNSDFLTNLFAPLYVQAFLALDGRKVAGLRIMYCPAS